MQLKIKLLGIFFLAGFILLTSTTTVKAGFPVTIVADVSPSTINQTVQMTNQTTLQSQIFSTNLQSKIAQGLEYVRTAERWVKEVQLTTNQIVNQVKQFTSLKGILTMAEKQLGISEDTLKAVGEIGQIVQGIFTLKNNFISLVRTRLSMIESLEKRARSGVFDPQADLADLENYLKRTIAKSTKNTEITNEIIARTDDKLEKLNYDYKEIRAKRTAIQVELANIKKQIEKENALSNQTKQTAIDDDGATTTGNPNESRSSVSADAIQTLVIRRGQLEAEDTELKKQENETVQKIQDIYTKYTEKFDNAYYTAEYWKKVQNGWGVFAAEKANNIEVLLDTTGTVEPKKAPVLITK